MMLAMEEIMCELSTDHDQNQLGLLPPGFRFHPTDEELITFYLASKVFQSINTPPTSTIGIGIGIHPPPPTSNSNNLLNFAEVDLNRCEPWELPEVAKMGEREWYLLSVRDRKYPTGLRTNRATGAGYWKATGKDKEVYSNNRGIVVGMKKTLVFYKGRAPRGQKTKWVMHEYRLDAHFSPNIIIHSLSHHSTCTMAKEEWVICRIFHKSGEKRNSLLGHQHYFGASNSPTPTTTTMEHESQNDHNISIFPQHFPNIAAAATNTARNQLYPSNNSDQLLFKSHHLINQTTIPKTEATFYDHHHANNNNNNLQQQWMNHSNSNNNFQNSFLPSLDMDYSFSAAAAAAAAAEFRDNINVSSASTYPSITADRVVVALDNAPIGLIDSCMAWPQPTQLV